MDYKDIFYFFAATNLWTNNWTKTENNTKLDWKDGLIAYERSLVATSQSAGCVVNREVREYN